MLLPEGPRTKLLILQLLCLSFWPFAALALAARSETPHLFKAFRLFLSILLWEFRRRRTMSYRSTEDQQQFIAVASNVTYSSSSGRRRRQLHTPDIAEEGLMKLGKGLLPAASCRLKGCCSVVRQLFLRFATVVAGKTTYKLVNAGQRRLWRATAGAGHMIMGWLLNTGDQRSIPVTPLQALRVSSSKCKFRLRSQKPATQIRHRRRAPHRSQIGGIGASRAKSTGYGRIPFKTPRL